MWSHNVPRGSLYRSKMFKKIWELISNNRLLSALIVMAIGGFIKLFGPGLFSWLTKVLSVEYKNPLWLLILFHCLVAAILFIVLLLILRRRYATRHNPEPDYQDDSRA